MVSLIIDTLSIQNYVFGSNKLRENIGGSYIIEELIYKEMIQRALKEANIAPNIDIFEWKNKPGYYKLNEEPQVRVEIGYIGGGNTLLIFKNEEDSDTFIRYYSRLLLQFFPGIKTAFGIHTGFEYQQGGDYTTFRRELNDKLLKNRNFSAVQVAPFKHGIVEDCPWTNEAQEIKDTQSSTLISKMAYSRVNLVDDAQETLREKFKDQIGNDFTFTNDLEKLGQPDDKGYIAIVHADGNNMGQRFIGCESLVETRRLSAGVSDYADLVMQNLIGYIVNLFVGEKPTLDWNLATEEKSGKRILPIRPLIIGGDDITFVCEGRLGVHLAEKLLEFMHTTPINGETIHACAGVAVVHTKYPFYKAYQLAEELTKRAKKASRNDDGGSWLDYMISSGGFSGSLEDIIENQYSVPGKGQLKNGPYRVDGDFSMKQLKAGMRHFLEGTDVQKGNDKWPRNKIKDLRDTLRKDGAYQNYFLAEIGARKLSLPSNVKSLWEEEKTPYYDMIELLDFYPKNLLK